MVQPCGVEMQNAWIECREGGKEGEIRSPLHSKRYDDLLRAVESFDAKLRRVLFHLPVNSSSVISQFFFYWNHNLSEALCDIFGKWRVRRRELDVDHEIDTLHHLCGLAFRPFQSSVRTCSNLFGCKLWFLGYTLYYFQKFWALSCNYRKVALRHCLNRRLELYIERRRRDI